MRLYQTLCFLAFVSLITACKKAPKQSSIIDLIQKEETIHLVKTLSQNDFAGRKSGEKGYNDAALFCENYFNRNGLKPFFKNTFKDSLVVDGKDSYNILALIGDRNNNLPFVMLSAHLDHLGTADIGEDTIFNGANDDASGCTAVMQIAKALKDYDLQYNVIVALFAAEEDGLLGSEHLSIKLKNLNIDLRYVFNFEMIGTTLTSGKNQVYMTGFDKSNMAEVINQQVKQDFVVELEAEKKYNLFHRSDNYTFYEQFHIPSHTLSTFDFENFDYYHRVEDEFDKLNIDNMNNVIATSALMLQGILTDSTIKIDLK